MEAQARAQAPPPPPTTTSSGGGGAAAVDRDTLQTCLRHFARAILEGVAVGGLAKWRDALAAPPSALTKQGAAPSLRAHNLLAALERPRDHVRACSLGTPVTTRARLCAMWRGAPGYLAVELGAWVRESATGDFTAAWPGIVRGFLASMEQVDTGGM